MKVRVEEAPFLSPRRPRLHDFPAPREGGMLRPPATPPAAALCPPPCCRRFHCQLLSLCRRKVGPPCWYVVQLTSTPPESAEAKREKRGEKEEEGEEERGRGHAGSVCHTAVCRLSMPLCVRVLFPFRRASCERKISAEVQRECRCRRGRLRIFFITLR